MAVMDSQREVEADLKRLDAKIKALKNPKNTIQKAELDELLARRAVREKQWKRFIVKERAEIRRVVAPSGLNKISRIASSPFRLFSGVRHLFKRK